MIDQRDDRVGSTIANSRYLIRGRLGVGSMGVVYLAYDRHLDTEVVIKFPVVPDLATDETGLLERFGLEVRALVRLSHPHIVKIIDVGTSEGRPYVVLQYLSGGSLEDRIHSGPDGEPRPMPPFTLHDWLLDVARALDFIHAQEHIHRDVKPANIMFDAYGNAFLGDFGIIKLLSPTLDAAREASGLTAPGFLLGTPNYVAPELVMGLPGDGRSDQYSLALTAHEVLTGCNYMSGPTPSATMVNQTQVDPPELADLVPGSSLRLSEAIRRGLSKDPEERFPSCVALAQSILAEVPKTTPSHPGRATSGTVACPACEFAVPVSSKRSGEQVRCPRCWETAQVTAKAGALELNSTGLRPVLRLDGELSGSGMMRKRDQPPPARRWPSRIALVAVLALAGAAAWILGQRGAFDTNELTRRPGTLAKAPGGPVEINIAYGSEKEKWLLPALDDYRETAAGKRARINLIKMGSLDGAKAVLDGPGPQPIHVWSPASSLYRRVFENDWSVKHGSKPIIRSEDLAVTPMVFVFWKARYEEFIKKYGRVDFHTIGRAMAEPDGWRTIANKPEWGLFHFGHTHPTRSNSGLLGLVLMAYEHAHKSRGLTVADVTEPDFQAWLKKFEAGVTRPGGTLTESTGILMREMVQRGSSQFDCLLVYENLAIDYVDEARNRWGPAGELMVVYPDPNIWNEHPYYILDVPWSGPDQRQAAVDFLDFLLSERIQRGALAHGFRPGNASVSVAFPDSPLIKHRRQGLRIDPPPVCEAPSAEVLRTLMHTFQRLEP